VIRYTRGTSPKNAPSRQSPTIFIGQTYRHQCICSTKKN